MPGKRHFDNRKPVKKLVRLPFYIPFFGFLALFPLSLAFWLTGLMTRDAMELYMRPIILAAFGPPWLGGIYCNWCNYRGAWMIGLGWISPDRYPRAYYTAIGIPILLGLTTLGIGGALLIRVIVEGK
jgi:hypothetical protein